MLLLILAFIAGVLTVLAPCVLPLLPIIIGGSLAGDTKQKSRPYIIAASLIVSLVAFTLLLKVSTVLIGVDPKVWVYVSGGIVIVLGLVSLFPGVWEQLIGRLGWQAGSQRFLGFGFRNKGAIAGPVLIGLALGPVFSSCSPTYAFILATVLPRNLLSGLLYITAYCLGLGLVLLGIAVFGQKFISKFRWAANPHSLFRRSLGILFILVGLAIITGWDKKAETFVTDHGPINITSLDQKLFEKSQNKPRSANSAESSKLLNVPATPAPELVGLQAWINSDPQTLASLKGKVVLIDFWTYSCINCQRTLPYVQKWYDTYKDKGFVVIGVHAPEFAFEKVEANVRKAVKDDNLTYPVALDNNFATWQAYGNQYWPAHYLIDKNGNVRQTHFGEGGYQETEQAIQLLLGSEGPLVSQAAEPSSSRVSPETYLGTNRAAGYVGTTELRDGNQTYTAQSVKTGQWTLGGSWTVAGDGITSQANATLTYKVQAKDVYLVVGSSGTQTIGVTVDGKPSTVSGESLTNGTMQLDGARLYHISHLPTVSESTVQLSLPPGVTIYTFTFGG